jgi:hypothetical protein
MYLLSYTINYVVIKSTLTQDVRNVGALLLRLYDTIKVIRLLCVSPKNILALKINI